jgi:hypothetical protein
MDIFEAKELIEKYAKCSEGFHRQIIICLNVIKKNEEISEEKLITIGYSILINTLNSNKGVIRKNYSIEEFNEYLSAIETIQNYLDSIKIINKLIMKG